MTKREKELLKMSEEEFKKFERTQLQLNGQFLMKAEDYISWLKRTKYIEVSVATVRNKIKEGAIDSMQHMSFYPENNGVTQAGKKTTKKKFSTFIIMNLTTMSYEGYNDGGGVGKPTISSQKKKERLKQNEEEMAKRGIDMSK